MILDGIPHAPVFGHWTHTADELPTEAEVVLGIWWDGEGFPKVDFVFLAPIDEDDIQENGAVHFSDLKWVLAVKDERTNPPDCWNAVRFCIPTQRLGKCDDCGGFYKDGEASDCCDNT